MDGRDEVGRLSTAFNTMLARLAAAREAQDRLVQDAAHELRTPLTSLRTNASVLRRIDELSPDARARLVADVQGETRELSHLVDELVELALSGRRRRARGARRPRRGGPRAAERVRRRTGREMRVDTDEVDRSGRPAAQGLERAVGNLLENAAKFAARRTDRRAGGRAAASPVADRGPGIAAATPDDVRPVLPRRHRTRAARLRARPVDRPGRGEAHGGSVFARPRAGGGAEVGFRVEASLLPNSELGSRRGLTRVDHGGRSPTRPPPGSPMTTETTTSPLHSERPRPESEPSPRVRASTSEREETVARLHHALGEGRLDLAETETRIAAAYAAQYRDELPPLLADLPAGAGFRSTAPTWQEIWVSGVWRARSAVTGAVGEQPTPGECRTAALLVVTALIWMTICAVLAAAAVG